MYTSIHPSFYPSIQACGAGTRAAGAGIHNPGAKTHSPVANDALYRDYDTGPRSYPVSGQKNNLRQCWSGYEGINSRILISKLLEILTIRQNIYANADVL